MAADMNALNDAPESPADLGIDDPDAFEREQREKFGAALDEAQGYDEETAEALEILREPSIDDRATVPLGEGVEVPVKTYANGRIERQARELRRYDEDNPPEVEEYDRVLGTVIDIMTWFIDDDKWARADIWRAYAEEYGTRELVKKMNVVTDPYARGMQEAGETGSFRGDG